VTALFGIAMVIIGSTVEIDGKGGGADLLVKLAGRLAETLGTTGRWVFLIGAFGAVFSSLLGVWQAVPYLFADTWRLRSAKQDSGAMLDKRPSDSGQSGSIDTKAVPYRAYMYGMAVVPMLGLLVSFQEVQKLYAIVGAAFIPLLGAALLVLNGRRAWVGDLVNRRSTVAVLVATLVFSAWIVWRKLVG
jgi:hypothetical protein